MTSHLLYKTRCPKCAEHGRDRSGDNLGVYSDGHSYCFSCGHGSGATLSGRLAKGKKADKVAPPLPEDLSEILDPTTANWLLQYFTDGRFPSPCLWSASERKLFFLLPGGEYQYRYFGDNPSHPKWVGYGISDQLFHIVGDLGNSIVLVEDLLSACKVGHITPAMPLFGSHIGLKRLARLKQMGIEHVTIWLDNDKKEYAVKASHEAQMLGLKTSVVITDKDPKEYSYEDIATFLNLCYTDNHKAGISPATDEGELNECTSSPAKPPATCNCQGIQATGTY